MPEGRHKLKLSTAKSIEDKTNPIVGDDKSENGYTGVIRKKTAWVEAAQS